MKTILSVVACLAVAGCGQGGPAEPKAAAEPASSASQTASEVRVTDPVSGYPVVVPVGDDNPTGIPDATYPATPALFADVAAATPKGWRVEYQVSGDLNNDRRPDLVLVLQEQNPANIVRNEGFGPDALDTNPRMLVIGLAGDNGYDRVAQNHTFIPRHVFSNMEDALEQAPDVRNGVLSIPLHFFASAGGWTMFNSTARFRWQDGALRLIGHDYSEVQRNSGATLDRSINFLTRRISTVQSSIDVEKDPAPVWTRLPDGPLLTIDQVGDGLEFDPTGSSGT
jgi:hypothetical protein